MDLMTAVASIPYAGPALPYLTALVAVAAALAPFLPAPKLPASGWYPLLYGAVNFVALNLGHAKNAGAEKAPAVPTVQP